MIRPASSTVSLFHCATTTPGLVACSSGTTSTSGCAVISMPPTWTERWRGTPIIWAARSVSSARLSAGGSAVRRAGSPGCAQGCLAATRFKLLRRKTQRPRDVAHGQPRLVGDDVADQRRVLAAVALVDVGDHLVAAVAVEVEVDVGHGVRAVAEEALEQQVVRQRVHRRDAQHVGHERVGGRAAALAADAARPRLPHDVPDDQEVVGQAGRLDHRQLVGELLDGRRRDRAVFGAQAGVRQGVEVAERGLARRDAVREDSRNGAERPGAAGARSRGTRRSARRWPAWRPGLRGMRRRGRPSRPRPSGRTRCSGAGACPARPGGRCGGWR